MQFRSALHALYWLEDSSYMAERTGSSFSQSMMDIRERVDGSPSVESFECAVHARRDLLRLMGRLPKAQRYILATYCFRASLVKGHAAELVAAYPRCTEKHGYRLISGAMSDYERILIDHGYVRDLSGIGDAHR